MDRPEPGAKPDLFRRAVALMIVVVSVAGTFVGWRAAVKAGEASGLERRETQERALREQDRTTLEAQIAHDRRLVPEYGAHVESRRRLLQGVARIRAIDPTLGDVLDREAAAEAAQIATTARLFVVGFPRFEQSGALTYDPGLARRRARLNPERGALRPEGTRSRADDAQADAVRLKGVATILIASLFFFTVAQLTRPGVREPLAGVGAVMALASLVLFAIP